MYRKWIALIVMLVLGVNVIHAQSDAEYRISYYLKADANGVQQVYQLPPLNSQVEARQITHAVSDVLTYASANDGLSVAYISGGQLWLQPVHVDEAEALAPVSATQFFRSPVYSPDGQYIAYPDKGVWLLDLGTRKTRQLLKDVPVNEAGDNMPDMRLYAPEQFVIGADGKASKLVVDVGIWEWNTVGIYDLASGKLQELEGEWHTDLLPLSDGRVLLYGNTGLGGNPSLHIADSFDDINSYSTLVDFGDITSETLYANQAIEIVPSVVRIFGQTIATNPSEEVEAFYFDYDMVAHKVVSQVKLVTLSDDTSNMTQAGPLSPDGNLLPVYHNAIVSEAGVTYGDFELINLKQNQVTARKDKIGLFRWQLGYLGP